MFGRECNHTLSVLLSCACFPSKLMQKAQTLLSKSQAIGMRQRSRQCERFIAALERLVRVAELPQSEGRGGQALHPCISPSIAESKRPMALAIIERIRLFNMLPRAEQLSHPKRGM